MNLVFEIFSWKKVLHILFLVLFYCYLSPYLFWQGTSLIWNRSPQYISFGRGWGRHLLNQSSPRDNFSPQQKRKAGQKDNRVLQILNMLCWFWILNTAMKIACRYNMIDEDSVQTNDVHWACNYRVGCR